MMDRTCPWNEKFLVLFDHPLGDVFGVIVYGWNIHEEEPEHAYTIDRDFNHIQELTIQKASRTQIDDIPAPSSINKWDLYP